MLEEYGTVFFSFDEGYTLMSDEYLVSAEAVLDIVAITPFWTRTKGAEIQGSQECCTIRVC